MNKRKQLKKEIRTLGIELFESRKAYRQWLKWYKKYRTKNLKVIKQSIVTLLYGGCA